MPLPSRFDRYLAEMAERLTGAGHLHCQAIIPDVDGGLIISLRDPEAGQGAIKVQIVRGEEGRNTYRFTAGKRAAGAVEMVKAAFLRFVGAHPHPLLEFVGQEMVDIPIGARTPLQEIWRQHLAAGKTRWGAWMLESLEKKPGALDLLFDHEGQKVALRLLDKEDQRLSGCTRVLLVNKIAIALIRDDRPAGPPSADQVERFVAYLLAHTTGPASRITTDRLTAPARFDRGAIRACNPFVSEGQQGASGMAAALFGAESSRIQVIALGDASCRQTFPWTHSQPMFDSWTHFPVHLAPTPGGGRAIDFGDREVVGGAEEQLSALIRALKDRNPQVKVALVQTCLSRMIGDDVRRILASELAPADFVILDPDFRAREAAVDSLVWPWLLETFRPERAQASATEEPRRINLVGFGQREQRATAELCRDLADLGIAVNAAIFPSFDENELARFDEAAWTIINPCRIVGSAFSRVQRRPDASRWLELPAPFGLTRTDHWLRLLIEQTRPAGPSRREALERLEHLTRAHREAHEATRKVLEGHAVLLMASCRFSAFLFDERESFGVPLLDLFLEIGLDVQILLLEDGPVPPDLKRTVQGRAGVELSLHPNPEQLLAAARQSGADLLLTSEQRNDFALSAGKMPIRIQAIEMGFAGAGRTARRFASAIASGFAAEYKGYLQT